MNQENPNKIKAIGYARVSGHKQKDKGMSLEYQQEMIEAYCKFNNLELVEIVIDGARSAYKQELDRRADGRRVMQLTESGEVGAVVAVRLDRLFRSQDGCVRIVGGWTHTGVALHLLDLGGSAVDTSTPIGKLVLYALVTMAQLESQAKSERMCEVWAHVKKQGKILGKTPPFGYSVGTGNTLIEDEDEQDTISRIKEWRSGGSSYREIVDKLTQEGRKPRGTKWNMTTVVRILKANPI